MKKQNINKAGEGSVWTSEMLLALSKGENNNRMGGKVDIENENMKKWSIRLSAGKGLPFHKNSRSYFCTILSEDKSRSQYNDVSVVETVYQIDDTKYFKVLDDNYIIIHNLENIGEST